MTRIFDEWIGFVYVLIAIAACAILASAINLALGSSGFPPIGYLARELGVSSGQPLPKGVVYNGRPFFFYVVGAQEHGNGRYTVELQAR